MDKMTQQNVKEYMYIKDELFTWPFLFPVTSIVSECGIFFLL